MRPAPRLSPRLSVAQLAEQSARLAEQDAAIARLTARIEELERQARAGR